MRSKYFCFQIWSRNHSRFHIFSDKLLDLKSQYFDGGKLTNSKRLPFQFCFCIFSSGRNWSSKPSFWNHWRIISLHEVSDFYWQKESRNFGSKKFCLSYRITIIVVIVAILTFAIIALGISLLLFRNCTRTGRPDISCEVKYLFNLSLIINQILQKKSTVTLQ